MSYDTWKAREPDPFAFDEREPEDEDGGLCGRCGGEGDLPARRMGIIMPDTSQSDRPGDFFICPHCGGTGREP